jgi:hypothetical protein
MILLLGGLNRQVEVARPVHRRLVDTAGWWAAGRAGAG